MISLIVPSGLGTAPKGDMWLIGKGGTGKGPAVCPRDTSLLIAVLMAVLFWSADLRFLGNVGVKVPVNPMSNPFRSPSSM